MLDLYLDVDGVINVISESDPQTWKKWAWGLASLDGVNYRIHWSQDMVAALNGLGVNIHWLTTWEDSAATAIQPLTGINAVSVIPQDPDHDFMIKKYEAVMRHRELSDDPDHFIWIDDFQIPNIAYHEFTEALLIAPFYRVGIQPSDVEVVQTYVEKYAPVTV